MSPCLSRMMLLLIAFGMLSVSSCTAEPPSTFTFRFAPPDGTKFVQKYKVVKEKYSDDDLPQKIEATSLVHGAYQKIGENYLFKKTPVRSEVLQNGKKTHDPLNAAFTDVDINYEIGPAGELKQVSGLEQVVVRLRNDPATRFHKLLVPFLSESALIEREKVDWHERYTALANKSFSIGDVLENRTPNILRKETGSGFVSRSVFTRWESCPAGRCIRLDTSFSIDAESLRKSFYSVPTELIDSKDGSALKVENPLFEGTATRLIDPMTMLVYSEHTMRRMTITVAINDRIKTTSRTIEEHKFEYSYQ